ncbi:MAG: hypothetical protein KKC84_06870, partial [Candidatus Omnitrophica bacterium]|nr:hypothetical protein [Candidatus Omnitrophota bacterium]
MAQVIAEFDLSSHFAALGAGLPKETFRPLHLRSLQFDPSRADYYLILDRGDYLKNLFPQTGVGHFPSELQSNNFKESVSLTAETRTLLNYFLIGLTLPNKSFWVNLRPDSAREIIDPYLEQTDVGKIL